MSDSLPGYARRLDALHAALADDFSAIVGSLNLRGDEQVLDAGCGTGFFSSLLAQRTPTGVVIALDTSKAFLESAESSLKDLVAQRRVRLLQGDVQRLPLDDGSVDVAWSAHSMQSYDDIPAVLAEFRRVLRPGGRLAVLESDAMHSIMLPWPARVESAVRQAELRLLGDQDERRGAYFPRYAARLLGKAGFENFLMRPTLVYRSGPFPGELASYVNLYCEDVLQRLGSHLSDFAAQAVERLAHEWSKAPDNRVEERYFASLQMLVTGQCRGGGG